MNTLFMHLGLPKCGSTAIQNTLTRNQDLLAKNNLAYYYELPKSYGWNKHYYLIDYLYDGNTMPNRKLNFTPYTSSQKKEIFHELWKPLKQQLNHSNIIFSEEFTAGLIFAFPHFFDWILDFFKDNKLTFVLYVRPQEVYINSYLSEEFRASSEEILHAIEGFKKTGNVSSLFSHRVLTQNMYKSLFYDDLVKKLAEKVGQENIRLRFIGKNHEESEGLFISDVVQDFFEEVLCINETYQPIEKEKKRTRYSKHQMAYDYYLQKVPGLADNVRNSYVKRIGDELNERYTRSEKASFLNLEMNKVIFQHFESSNQNLLKNYFGRDKDSLPFSSPKNELLLPSYFSLDFIKESLQYLSPSLRYKLAQILDTSPKIEGNYFYNSL